VVLLEKGDVLSLDTRNWKISVLYSKKGNRFLDVHQHRLILATHQSVTVHDLDTGSHDTIFDTNEEYIVLLHHILEYNLVCIITTHSLYIMDYHFKIKFEHHNEYQEYTHGCIFSMIKKKDGPERFLRVIVVSVNGIFEQIDIHPSFKYSNYCSELPIRVPNVFKLVEKFNSLIVATWRGELFLYDFSTHIIRNFVPPSPSAITSMYVNDHIILGLYNGSLCTISFDSASNKTGL
jgi:hypothetical protein